VTCLGGTFFVQDGINRNFGFGIYDGAPMTWADAGGYLPAQVTTFRISGATVSITEFADKVVLGGDSYVAVYSRVAVDNATAHVVVADPAPSAGLVALNTAPDTVTAMGSASMITWWRSTASATTTRGPRRPCWTAPGASLGTSPT